MEINLTKKQKFEEIQSKASYFHHKYNPGDKVPLHAATARLRSLSLSKCRVVPEDIVEFICVNKSYHESIWPGMFLDDMPDDYQNWPPVTIELKNPFTNEIGIYNVDLIVPTHKPATARLHRVVQKVPKPKDDKYYDEIYKTSKHYSLDIKPEDSGYFSLYCKVIEQLSFSDSILEIGCGTGIFAHILISQDYNYVLGFDFSEVAVSYSIIRTDANLFKQIDINDFDFNSVQFNTIISLEVFEHIEHDIELINRIPSGKKIIFSVPNFDDVAHVRFFNSIVDVENRYSQLFSEFNIIRFGNIFIINAIK